jgi:hypothetical protein
VDVRGNVVGRGVVLEIEDQGLGIEPARADDFNNMLSNPPDFGIMALSSEPRLGLFVVARLAARHGISVTLRESAYGGTRAIVLVRNELLGPADKDAPQQDEKPAEQKRQLSEPATEVNLRPVDLPTRNGNGSNGDHPTGGSVRLSIPGAVNLPDLPPLPMVEPRPGEDLFRPQRPVGADHEPSKPVRREPRHAEQPPPWPEEPVRDTEQAQNGNGQHALGDDQQRDGDELTRPEQRPQLPRRQGSPRHAEAERPVPLDSGMPELHQPAPLDADTRQEPQVAQVAPGRPPLPQRRRQQNLAPQLRDEPPAETTVAWPEQKPEQNREDSPEQARSRLAAFQAGTRRGRDEPPPGEQLNGNDSVGSAHNGQHSGE